MRAWQISGNGEPAQVLQEVTTELEPVGPGELHIKVAAAALGFPDVLQCRGLYPLAPPTPFTPGQEFVGTVTAVGAGVSTPVGTRLMGVAAFMIGRGAFAEECKTYEPMTFPVAPGMADADAAAFVIGYHTAYIALVRRAQLRAGETLLVHGAAGGTGAAAVQLGKALGARVIATARGGVKLQACKTLGADEVIDYGATDFVAAVNRLTGGRGADVVFDPVGGEIFENSINCVAPEARLLPIGFACGRWGAVSPHLLALKNLSIVGALGGGFDRDYMLSMHAELLQLFSRGAIKVAVDRRIGFADIRTGLTAVAERKVLGRIVACLE